MPEISRFLGIVVQMFWRDHQPPHFHALYGEAEAVIEIQSLLLIHCALPRRALALTLEWAALHREALMEDWHLCATKQPPKKIAPLE